MNTIEDIFNKKPLIIAGPCSAESKEQVNETAKAVSQIDAVDMLRAGIWKPRTSPESFEGVGEKGLKWLKAAREETELPFIVEVATPVHVKEALEYDADAIWIGARTSVNPFSVQAIADTLKDVDIPVFIKNPINPEVKLWNGAVERIEKAGIENIGLIHRGFSTTQKSPYRYQPLWERALEMKDEHPDKPFIADPSHIAGDSELVFEVAKEAVGRDYDGLMIETHINPAEAKSDADQQLTPDELKGLLDELEW